MSRLKELLMHGVFLLAACVSIASVALICGFLVVNSVPALQEIGLIQFLTGQNGNPAMTSMAFCQ